ncbi:uncharacterized protein M6B38_412380 [Iris pallida]|uniref:Glycosyl transferase family 1 domain-containing protein n=1 Tax=Iris pallida TaxID=29817 RepID=A0AAX6FLT1_IRIPA|nr:uncharacterized protein M6B38_412380 [Iris pallida]
MSSTNTTSSPQNQSPPTRQNNPNPKCKPLSVLCSSALLTLLLAFLLQHHHQLTTLLFTRKQALPLPISTRPPCVLWMAPFLSPGGYSSEAWSYISSLSTTNITLNIHHHADSLSLHFWQGLPENLKSLAYKLHRTTAECALRETIVVCHSEAGAWYPPLYQTPPCPPTGYNDPLFVVGRTMFETDRLTPGHVQRCNRMGAVWVPTEFHVKTFVRSGVDRSKVVKLVQPVDVDFFDPSEHEALVLPGGSTGDEFVFLSVFKWEHRKGWDVLMRAFLEEFSRSDGVALYLLVSAYHSDTDFRTKVASFIQGIGVEEPADGWAPFHVIDTHVPQVDLPGLYKAADAFVLPSRGEGWGRPIVEAMAMGLPVIATNWSGMTEYLTEENGYPLRVDRMSEVTEGPFEGHRWAEPSSNELRVLMRHVASNREEGRKKGRRAREDMIERFSPEVVARLLADEIMKIWKKSHGEE